MKKTPLKTMRWLLWGVVLSFCFAGRMGLYAAPPAGHVAPGTYEVQVNTSLTIRDTPSVEGQKIGSASNGECLEVTGFTGDWACIVHDGREGYVSTKYLKPVVQAEETPAWMADGTLLGHDTYKFLYEKMPYVLLVLGVLLLLLSKTELAVPVMVLLGLAELLFAAGVSEAGSYEMVWFCNPTRMGWLYTSINFVLLVALLAFQHSIFRALMGELAPGCLGTVLSYPLALLAGFALTTFFINLEHWWFSLLCLVLLWGVVAWCAHVGMMRALRGTLLMSVICGGFLMMVWQTAGVLLGGFLIIVLILAVANGSKHAPSSPEPAPEPSMPENQNTGMWDRPMLGGDPSVVHPDGSRTDLHRNSSTGEWEDDNGNPWNLNDSGGAHRK